MAEKIRVLLADDHVLVRQGIRQFLESAEDMTVVAETDNGQEVLELVERTLPDVALLDIQMPGMNGVEAARQIKSRYPQVRVLILTAYDDDPYIFAAVQAGADGYLLKRIDVEDLLRAVRAVHRGDAVLSPEVTARVMRQMQTGRPTVASEQIEALTARELEVLRLAARGLSNKEIGRRVGISDRTVQGHLANIYGKLGVAGRTEAVTEALKRGWIILES
jgi:NarL family two-component system response regulator LiaR